MMYWIQKYFSHLDIHLQAAYEVIMVSVFSLAPFAIALFVRSANLSKGADLTLDDIVGRGQIYLLAYGIFGTVFWLAFLKSDRPRHGARALLGAIATVAVLPLVGFIGVDPTFSTILNSNVVTLGYYYYGGLLFIYYLLLFYMHIDPPEPTDVLNREADGMRRRYEELSNG